MSWEHVSWERASCPYRPCTEHISLLLKFIFCTTFLLHYHYLFFLIHVCHFFFWPLSWEKLSQTRALKAQKSHFPEYRWVIVGQHPALLTIQHQPFQMEAAPLTPSQQELGTYRAAQSCCSQGGGSCSPFPRAGLSLASSHSPCKPYLCVRGKKNPALWTRVLYLACILFYNFFFLIQINAIFWGFHSLDLQWAPHNMLSGIPEMCPKERQSCTDHPGLLGNLLWSTSIAGSVAAC